VNDPIACAELAVTTNYSFLHGASHPHELVREAHALGLSAIGIADRNSVAGVVRAHVEAAECGLRLLVGARLVFSDDTPDILAYPRDRAAWGRLCRLLTLGNRRAERATASSTSTTSSDTSKACSSSSCRPAPVWNRLKQPSAACHATSSGSAPRSTTAATTSATCAASRPSHRSTRSP